MDVHIRWPQGQFNLCARGILIIDDHVLLCYWHRDGYYGLPGGRVALHETAEQALQREWNEELGLRVTVDSLAYVIDNHFLVRGEPLHNLELDRVRLEMSQQGRGLMAQVEEESAAGPPALRAPSTMRCVLRTGPEGLFKAVPGL